MSIKVFAWPPVGAVGTEWTEEAPIERSRSLLTGADYVSTRGRIRRLASIEVPALGLGLAGAGYMEMLKRHLAGGVHAVRLYSYPVNSHLLARDQTWPVTWTAATERSGTTGTDSDGWSTVTISGFPANKLVARPGDFVAIDNGGDILRAQVTAPAVSDATGEVVIRLFDDLPGLTPVTVKINLSDTGVFRAVELPRAIQPLGSNWAYSWQFREVFADEVGGFTEVDPWR